MLGSILALPLFWAFFLWVLPWLEERTLTPEERAEKIEHLLEKGAPEEIEREVADLLAQSIAHYERRWPRPVLRQTAD